MILSLVILILGQVAFFDELDPLYADSSTNDGPVVWKSDTARGMTAGVHVLIDRTEFKPERLRVLDSNGDAVDGVAVCRLHDVPVEENTGLDSRTEQFKGDLNPHVIRRAPFRIYEAIEPLSMREGF